MRTDYGVGCGSPLVLSPLMRDVYDLASRSSRVDFPVLIHGESGVGKDVLARYIHANSRRANTGGFLPLNCAAVEDSLAESELFGYAKGAFTGADVPKAGLLEAANGGTLFLDEITEMSPTIQGKLLRALETKEFLPVGATTARTSDFRLICATNADLKRLMENRLFRADLYFRFSAITIEVPPLRDRIEEIPPLACSFLKETGHADIEISADALELLVCYNWPGNVRELKNVIEFSVTMISEDEKTIKPKHFPKDKLGAVGCDLTLGHRTDFNRRVKCFKEQIIKQALMANGGSCSATANDLGVSKGTVYNSMRGRASNLTRQGK